MSASITIVGLGYSPHKSEPAASALSAAATVYVRTAAHPAVANIPGQVAAFDHQPDPDQIAADVVRLGRQPGGVVYAVPGHPLLGDATVPAIRRQARAAGLTVTLLPGAGPESTLEALELDGLAAVQLVEAGLVAGRYHPPLESDRPALILHVTGQAQAAQLQAALRNAYPAATPVTLVQYPPQGLPRLHPCRLAELDSQPALAWLCSLYIPAQERSGFSTFQATIAHLRAPDGCPWDREQTHQSLRPYLLEETYEVLEALDAGDPDALAEELGDLLLQIVLHAQVAIDHDEFNMSDVIDQINRKLLRRHPHVFGNVQVNSVAEVTANWQAIKRAEKADNGQTAPPASALDGVPPALPALAQALDISKRAVRVGFEWPNIEGVLDKVIEEAHEIVEAHHPDHLESEIGDLLFSVVNLARWRNIDPESALRSTNARFSRRFRAIEALAAARGQQLPQLTLAEMDDLWEIAKQAESVEPKDG